MKNIDIVCFGGGDWWYHNRAHIDMQLMRRFARESKVLYINSIVIQKPKFGKKGRLCAKISRKVISIMKGLRPSGEGFWVYSPVTMPVHHISWGRWLNERILRIQVKHVMKKLNIQNPLIYVACPGACDTGIKLGGRKLVWQRTDRWEEFPNVDNNVIRKYDQKLKRKADLTIFVNNLLYKQERDQCKKALYLDHGVDYELFATADRVSESPNDIKSISKPIIGFFGGIDDHTLDISFVQSVVDLLPELSFVFIGKVSCDIDGLQKKQNVWFLGQKPYEQIPHYGIYFDVAIMPWRQNRWIEACNPIKLKEYLALGKPVVSTPFSELEKYLDVVYRAQTPKQFAECIKKALTEDNPMRIADRRNKVMSDSWESKAKLLLEELFISNETA